MTERTNPPGDGPDPETTPPTEVTRARNASSIVARLANPLQNIGPYRIVQVLGEGGMGVVYLAEQTKPIHRKVALKIIKLGMDTKQVMARFEAEREALALMNHPNVARVFDAGATEQGRPYFVMEYVEGEALTKYCDRNRLPTKDRLKLFMQVCNAVQHAHQKGIIHRDLKPSNVLVTKVDDAPAVKVIDFGIAKATQQRLTEATFFTEQGQLVGTPAYMSPEQADPTVQDIDTRTDIYSLGVILYQLLVGALPFEPRTLRSAALMEIVRIIREVDPPKPSTRLGDLQSAPRKRTTDSSETGAQETESAQSIAALRQTDPASLIRQLRGDLDWIVMRCLEKDRARRYDSANGIALELERYLNHEPVLAGPPSATYRVGKFIRRNRLAVTAAALVIFALTAGLIVSDLQRRRAVRAEGLAEDRLTEAQRQTKIAQAVNAFLNNDLLAAVDPERTTNREITMREVLDAASEKIEGKFENEPLIEASIRGTLSQTYLGLGLYEPAENHLRRAETIQSHELGIEASETLQARSALADLLRRRGWFLQAESLARETLEVQRRVLGDNDASTAFTLDALGQILMRQGKYAEAVIVLRQAMESRGRILGDEHSETLMSMSTLAKGLLRLGKCDEAEALHRRILEAQRRTLGEEHPRTLASMSDLGSALECQGELDEAETVFRQAMSIQGRTLGEEHPDTLQSMYDLASLAWRTGRLDEAEEILKRTLEARRRALGVAHLSVASTTDVLMRVFRARAKFGEAKPYALRMFADFDEARKDEIRTNPYEINAYSYAKLTYEPVELRDPVKALAVAEKLLEMPNLAPPDYRTLSIGYEQNGRLDDAIQMQRNGLSMLPVDSDTAWGWFGEVTTYPGVVYWRTILETRLINSLRKKGDSDGGEAVLREAVARTLAAHDRQRGELVREMMGLGVFLASNDRFLQHEWFCGDIAEVRKGVIPRGEPGIAGFVVIYAQALVEQERYAEAEPYLRQCLKIQEMALPVEDWHIAHTRSVLGTALGGKRQFLDAQPLLLDGYKQLKDEADSIPNHFRTAQLRSALERIVKLYDAWDAAEPGKGYAEKAAEWRAKLNDGESPN